MIIKRGCPGPIRPAALLLGAGLLLAGCSGGGGSAQSDRPGSSLGFIQANTPTDVKPVPVGTTYNKDGTVLRLNKGAAPLTILTAELAPHEGVHNVPAVYFEYKVTQGSSAAWQGTGGPVPAPDLRHEDPRPLAGMQVSTDQDVSPYWYAVRVVVDEPGHYRLGPIVVRYTSGGHTYRQEFDSKVVFDGAP